MPPGWKPTTCSLGSQDDEALAAAVTNLTARCGLVVYTTVFYPGDPQRLPDPRSRLMFQGVEAFREQEQVVHAADGEKGERFLASTGVDGVPGDTCFLIVAGRSSAKALRQYETFAPWMLLEVPEPSSRGVSKQRQTGGGVGPSGRRASRQLKLLPHLFFRGPLTRFTIFMDWKLELQLDPRRILRAVAVRGAGFAALRHPCTTTYYEDSTPVFVKRLCQPFQRAGPKLAWYREEADHVIQNRATANVQALKRQVARYTTSATSGQLGDLYEFAEGALLIRDHEHPVGGSLNCAWWAEYTREDSSDRDQLSLAYVLASRASPTSTAYSTDGVVGSGGADPRLFAKSTERGGVFIISEGPTSGACKDLCHWYHGTPRSHSIGALIPKQGNKRLPTRLCEKLWWCRDHGSTMQSPLRKFPGVD
jgi:hypothetical protein